MTNSNKVYSLMGFASKARKIVTGYNTCLKMIPAGKIGLLIMGEDVGESTKKKMQDKCMSYQIPIREYGNCSELSHAVGKRDKGLFGITEENFAKSIMDAIDREREVF